MPGAGFKLHEVGAGCVGDVCEEDALAFWPSSEVMHQPGVAGPQPACTCRESLLHSLHVVP